MALVSDKKTEGLFLNQRNSSVILKVADKTGLTVQAQIKDFVSLPESACVMGNNRKSQSTTFFKTTTLLQYLLNSC